MSESRNNYQNSQMNGEANANQQRRAFTVRTTKYRHLNGTILGRESQITNFNGLSKTIAGECDVFKVNRKYAAIPIGPSCNQLAIIGISRGERLSGGVIPHLVCGHGICDFAFDPFNDERIAIGCDNGVIQLWNIPDDGLKQNITEFDAKLVSHNDRITIIQFHPNASNVLASYAMDMNLIIWDLSTLEPKITIDIHTERLFGISWSPNGKLLATFCKDQKVRIFDVLDDAKLLQQGSGPQGSRGGRVCWAQNGELLIVSGFSRISERQFYVYNSADISQIIASEGLDVSPAILVPYFDEDSSTLFLTGKGDSTIFAFEISSPSEGAPYIHHLSHYNASTPHQSVCFLPKQCCDVKTVEFARAFRLTTTSIEPISFTVPRLRNEYFQDDLFPPTKETSKPLLSSKEWFSGVSKESIYVNLQPEGMLALSEAPPPVPTKKESDTSLPLQFEGDISLQSPLAFLTVGRQTREMIFQQMSDKVEFKDDELPQNHYEGVDPNEWDD